MDEVRTKLRAESCRREIFERKNAELETINDDLRTDNHRLLAEIEELKEKLTLVDHADLSDSSDDHGYEEFARGGDRSLTEKENLEMPPSDDGNLLANHNHSNANNASEDKNVKIQTLKRKQKELKAELEQTLCRTMSFQEAFQNEMDLRTKLDEKYDNLRVRYERLVLENDSLRTVLVNHCINVPPHQPITGKRHPIKPAQPLHRPPPSFVPPGRPKSCVFDNDGSHHGSSPNLSITSKSSAGSSISEHYIVPAVVISQEEPTRNQLMASIDETNSENATGSNSNTAHVKGHGDTLTSTHNALERLPGDALTSTQDGLNALPGDTLQSTQQGVQNALQRLPELSASEMSDSEEEEEESSTTTDGDSEEQIVFNDSTSLDTPTSMASGSVIQEIDALLVASADQIANAKTFYELVRERVSSEQDSD